MQITFNKFYNIFFLFLRLLLAEWQWGSWNGAAVAHLFFFFLFLSWGWLMAYGVESGRWVVSISLLLPDRRRAKLSVATAFYEVEKRLQTGATGKMWKWSRRRTEWSGVVEQPMTGWIIYATGVDVGRWVRCKHLIKRAAAGK